MRSRLRVALACALSLFVGTEAAHAAMRSPPRLPQAQRFVAANESAQSVAFEAGSAAQALSFVAFAGEAIAVDVSASSFADACAVELAIVDEHRHVVARQACAAGAGQAATLTAPAAGTFTLRLKARDGAAGGLSVGLRSAMRAAVHSAACANNALALDTPTPGSWDASCASVSFAGHFAQYYTITVPSSQVITLYLGSATNPYLVVHSGSNSSGPVLASDDNSGAGLDAQVVRTLAAGTYTIEATTASPGQTGTFNVVARTNTAPCFAKLAPNKLVNSAWSTACASADLDDHEARYYTLSVPSEEVVTITLSSATNAYLVVRSGNTQLGPQVAVDDNGGAGLDAQVVRSFAPGTYTIEATTASAGQLGNFTLVARTDTKPCFNKLALNATADSSWSTQCESVYLADHYAQYYSLKLTRQQIVTLSLSSATNAYLVLRSGTTQLAPVIAVDDNSGPGLDSRILMTLAAGDYVIEASTASPGQLGDFALTARTNTTPCFTPLALDAPMTDSWTSDCSSASFDDHYAKYYTLTVPASRVVTISLSSATNAYVVLRVGSSQLGPVLQQDDNSGPGLDAKVMTTLGAGTYLIEATTASPGQQGSFTLTARTNTAPCFQPLALDTPVNDGWDTNCSSASFDDHYARFYTLAVPTDEVLTLSLSSSTNAYFVIHDGPTQLGAVIAQDDNSGAGLDARVVRAFAAGTYTVEASTASPGQLGSYTIAARTNSAPCFTGVSANTTRSDSWSTSCTSTSFDDHYAKYYTLNLATAQSVTMLLTSATNAYLVLRSGDQLGPVMAQDDNSGGGLNAQITFNLAPGSYTIEATTASPGQLGDFVLKLSN